MKKILVFILCFCAGSFRGYCQTDSAVVNSSCDSLLIYSGGLSDIEEGLNTFSTGMIVSTVSSVAMLGGLGLYTATEGDGGKVLFAIGSIGAIVGNIISIIGGVNIHRSVGKRTTISGHGITIGLENERYDYGESKQVEIEYEETEFSKEYINSLVKKFNKYKDQVAHNKKEMKKYSKSDIEYQMLETQSKALTNKMGEIKEELKTEYNYRIQ